MNLSYKVHNFIGKEYPMIKLTITIALAAASSAGLFYFALMSYNLIGLVCCFQLFAVASASFVLCVAFTRPKPAPCPQAAQSQE